jgi:hypothetical protein
LSPKKSVTRREMNGARPRFSTKGLEEDGKRRLEEEKLKAER